MIAAPMEHWKCCGCGALSEDKLRVCDCPTGVVFRDVDGRHETARKIYPPELGTDDHLLLKEFARKIREGIVWQVWNGSPSNCFPDGYADLIDRALEALERPA